MEEELEESGSNASELAAKLLGLLAAALAAKAAAWGVELLWTKVFGQDLPGEREDESILRTALWVGLTAAAVAASREIAQGLAQRSRT